MFKIFKIKVKGKRVGLLSISYHSGKHNRKNKKYFYLSWNDDSRVRKSLSKLSTKTIGTFRST